MALQILRIQTDTSFFVTVCPIAQIVV